MGFKVETWIQDCPYWVQWTLHPHWKPGYRKNMILQCYRYYTRTPPSSSGILTPSSAEPAAILITLLTYQPYNFRIIHKYFLNAITHSSSYNIIINYHLHYSLVLTLTPTTNSSRMELGELVIFQPVLQAYPTRHSWIITTHVSLGNLECHWKRFTRQLARTHQFLRSLDQHPSGQTQLLSTLQLELSNIQDIYKPGESTITSAIQLLNFNQL